MRTVIHKLVLNNGFGFKAVEVPRGSKFISAQEQMGKLCVWFIVGDGEVVQREFFVANTSGEFEHNALFEFIDTVQIEGLVYHVFEKHNI